MQKKFFYKASSLLYGLTLIILGIVILAQGRVILNVAAVFGGIVLTIHGLHLLIKAFVKQDSRRISSFAGGILNVAGGVLMGFVPNWTISTMVILFAVYVFINAATKMFDLIFGKKDGQKELVGDLIAFLFYLSFGVLISFIPNMGIRSLIIVSGCYCILYGISQINDFLTGVLHLKRKNDLKRHFRVSTPVFISTFMPVGFLNKITKSYDKLKASDIHRSEAGYTDIQTDEGEPDAEVLIHVKHNGSGRMGHCDLVFEGRAYSYGNYDKESFHLFRLYGDGMFFDLDRDKYIRYSVKHDHKTIISYGLKLTEEQKNRIREEIAELHSICYEWKSPFQCAREQDSDTKFEGSYDFCSNVWYVADAKFYKFHRGLFKTYFVLSKNCALLMDQILGKIGIDIVKSDGIITPGSYFDYMERQIRRSNSFVFKRTIYNMDNTYDYKSDEEYVWEKD